MTPAIFAVTLLIIMWLMGGLAFAQVETPVGGGRYTLLEGLYWSMTTPTTVGYGDLSPSTPMGMVLTMILQRPACSSARCWSPPRWASPTASSP
jgi:hypothetical protein